jgi:hypothetical protein
MVEKEITVHTSKGKAREKKRGECVMGYQERRLGIYKQIDDFCARETVGKFVWGKN